jgi:catechol 2,3-dioxygenase-like lactoylglutathione lyase family enzyme
MPDSADFPQKEDSMEGTISRLLETYENGKLSRRDLVQGLVLLAASAGTMSAAGFQGNTINHVSLDVSDLQRSTDFYQRTFGWTVHKREGNNQVFVGKSFFVLRPGKPAGKVGHIAVGVENFNQDSVAADLKARGVTPIDSGQGGSGLGFHVMDPDGFAVQIVSASNTGRG